MKSLIIYFSRADENYNVGFITKGNTEVIAEYIKAETGADMFRVDPKVPYSKDYMPCIEEAKVRTRTHNAPILEELPDLSEYDILYIGAPVYWGGMPEEMFTALKGKDYSGKTIYPFVTHEGSGLSSIPSQIKSLCVGAKLMPGIAIQGARVHGAKAQIQTWLRK